MAPAGLPAVQALPVAGAELTRSTSPRLVENDSLEQPRPYPHGQDLPAGMLKAFGPRHGISHWGSGIWRILPKLTQPTRAEYEKAISNAKAQVETALLHKAAVQ